MVRAVFLATAFSIIQAAGPGQAPGVLRIRAVLRDAAGTLTPVPRHTLLVSDNPATALPRVLVTGLDGAAQVRLRPGSYTVESEQPILFEGTAYRWTQVVQIAAGRDAVLELTTDNAEVEPASAASTTPASRPQSDPSFLLTRWQNSVVEVWTPTVHASGFVIDARGLVATSQRAVAAATSAQVQFTSELKVAARVIAADAARDVAILRIDPKVAAAASILPLNCGARQQTPLAEGQEIFAIGVPPRRQKAMTSGTVLRLEATAMTSDMRVARGSAGGPVFTSDGTLIGMTSRPDGNQGNADEHSRVIRAADVCAVVASAEAKITVASAPSGTPLAVEPALRIPIDALREAVERGAGDPAGYSFTSSEFEVTFVTPVMIYGAQDQRSSRGRMPASEVEFLRARAMTDFGNWSDYVRDFPPVLFVRATPRLVEGFWRKVARGAARTQGIAIPPLVRFRSSFSRLRAFCGESEVMPVHPFRLELEIPKQDTIYEGFYAFDPGALAPDCGPVKLELYSEKDSRRGESKVVDPALIQRVWQEFETYRKQPSPR